MERNATISMKSARILALLRSPGIRFDPVSSRTVRVYWEPSYDQRIADQTSVWDFPKHDRSVIHSRLGVAAGQHRAKTGSWVHVWLLNNGKREYVGRVHGSDQAVMADFRRHGYTVHPQSYQPLTLIVQKAGDHRRMSTGAMRTKSRVARRQGVR